MQNNPAYKQLLEMGTNPTLSAAAIRQCKTEDLCALLDWISAHQEQEQKWAQWLIQNPGNQNQGQKIGEGAEEGQSITKLIKPQMRDQLMSKGHSKNVAQKALLFINNASIESAQKWIEQHKYDPDFEQQLKLQGQSYEESKLTPQQAKAKLQELTKKAREKRKQMQEQEARQREKNRIRYNKEMQQAKRKAQEQSIQRQLQLDRIQKQKDQEYKRKLVQDMRRQRNAKLGIKEQVGSVSQPKKQAPKLSMLQQVQIQCEQVKVGNHAYPDVARTFFETAQIYINNIIKNNGEEKFRKINKQNKAFQNRICQAFGGVELLTVIGYQEEDGFLVLKNYDLKELQNVSQILERYKSFY